MDDGNVHIKPCNDLIEHESTDNCICGPVNIPIVREDGSTIWEVVHHSLDGREQND